MAMRYIKNLMFCKVTLITCQELVLVCHHATLLLLCLSTKVDASFSLHSPAPAASTAPTLETSADPPALSLK